MGSSSSAYLAYGHDLGDDFGGLEAHDEDYEPIWPAWYVDDDGWEESAMVALLADAGFTETDKRAEGYWHRRKEATDALGIKFEGYGCDGFSALLMGAVIHEAYDYGSAEVDVTVPEGADERLAHARQVLGLEPEKPGWIIASYYG